MRILAASATLFIIVALPALSLGLRESEFSNTYYDLVGAYGSPDVDNTGLTALPVLNVPLGGEYEAMAKAYTAVSRDPSFFFANPAGSSELTNTEISIYHNNFIADTNLEGAVYTSRWGSLGVGAAGKYVHVPFTEYDDYGVQQGSYTNSEGVVGLNASYNFLNSFYFNGIALGTNVNFAWRNISGDPVYRNQYNAAAMMLDLGVLSKFNAMKFFHSRDRNTSFGLAIRNVGPNVNGDPLPTYAALGIAYAPIRPWIISFDVKQPFNPFSSVPAESLGYALGTSITVTDFFSIHSGFGLEGGNPRFSLGSGVDFNDFVVSMNYTIDMTTQLTAFNRISVNIRFNFGDRGREATENQVRTYYLDALKAFADGDLEETISLCESALELDPRFQPARETLEMAGQMLRLQNEMENIRTE